jgi:hydrogenase-4 component F
MLAYSSIENMGIIAFGTGIGGIGRLRGRDLPDPSQPDQIQPFLTSGNILLGFGNRLIARPATWRGRMPKTFVAFFGGFAGISGFPPFRYFYR